MHFVSKPTHSLTKLHVSHFTTLLSPHGLLCEPTNMQWIIWNTHLLPTTIMSYSCACIHLPSYSNLIWCGNLRWAPVDGPQILTRHAFILVLYVPSCHPLVMGAPTLTPSKLVASQFFNCHARILPR